MLHRLHKSGKGLTRGNTSLQVVITSKYLAVCPELPRPSITFPLTADGDYTAGDVKGSCSSAAPPCAAAPGARPGRGTRDGSGGREGGWGAEPADPRCGAPRWFYVPVNRLPIRGLTEMYF